MSKSKTKQQIRPPARQSEKSDKKSGAVKLLAISVLVLLGVVIFVIAKEKRTTQAVNRPVAQVTSRVRNQELVPPPFHIVHDFVGVESLPQVSPQQLRASADVILGLEGNHFLSTQDDQEIFALLKEYTQGKRTIHWGLLPEGVLKGSQGDDIRMGFNCIEDQFGVSAIQASTEFVALSFYHELMHAVDCFRYVREQHITDSARREDWYSADKKGSEKVAYAAQVRFFLALHSKSMLPTEVSTLKDLSDAYLFQQTLEVWYAIYDNQFGDWYDRIKGLKHTEEPGEGFIKEIGPAVK